MSRRSATSGGGRAPAKSRKGSKGSKAEEQAHHPFDELFMTEYATLLTMIIERGYYADGLIGVERYEPPERFEYNDDAKDAGIVLGSMETYYRITIDPITTQQQLTAHYLGLERFNMKLRHPDPRLNILIYYLLPEAEASGAAERKQLSEEHVKRYINIFELDETVNRLFLITRVKPSADVITVVGQANQMLYERKPLCLIKLVLASFFHHNVARWGLQPTNFTIYRGEERQTILDELGVAPQFKARQEQLLPLMSENDALSIYYGCAVGDVVSFIRYEPQLYFMRLVVPEVETQ